MKQWSFIALAAAASGAMLALSMPLAGAAGLGWVFLMPLLLAIRGQGAFRGFVGGIGAAMLGGWLSTTPIMGAAPVTDGTWAWNYVGFGLYGMAVAVFCAFVAEVKTHNLRSWLVLSCLGVAVECVTFIRMPAHLALSQFAASPMVAIASVTGIWGVSWILWAANLSVLQKRGHRWAAGAAALGVVMQAFSWTSLNSLTPDSMTADKTGQAGFLQTDQGGADALLPLQAPLAAAQPAFVVWPELSTTTHDREPLSQFAAEPGGWTVVTSMMDDAHPKPHNAAIAFRPEGESEPYHKRMLFGGKAEIATPGKEPRVVHVASMNVALNICFDSCYPWIMRDSVLAGANAIALPTLDPKSPNGFIQAAHGAFTPFRAAELGVPIVRAENTAWSMVVEPSGRITAKAGVGWEGAMARALEEPDRPTPYRRWGDWFLYASLAAVALGAFAALRDRVSPASSRPAR